MFKVRGNHDAECIFTRKLELPPNVTVFGSRKAESVELDELGVVLHGRSFAARSCADNLAATYPPAHGGRVNIGVLHTSLGGYEGHEPSPCSINDLVGRGYHYWALGHVHAANRVATEPCWIVYPGCLQGRNIREHGRQLLAMRVGSGKPAQIGTLPRADAGDKEGHARRLRPSQSCWQQGRDHRRRHQRPSSAHLGLPWFL